MSKHTNNLLLIDWEDKEIEITQILVVQFLNLLKEITRKGLKKSYYKKQREKILEIG